MMPPQMERLLERLQTGWAPRGDEIDMRIGQRTIFAWEFALSFSRPEAVLIGRPETRVGVIRTDVIIWSTRSCVGRCAKTASGGCRTAVKAGSIHIKEAAETSVIPFPRKRYTRLWILSCRHEFAARTPSNHDCAAGITILQQRRPHRAPS